MFRRLWSRYRRLTERLLWLACCVACMLCFLCVLLSLYYLEDHHDSLACQGGSKDNVDSHKTVLNSYPEKYVGSREQGAVEEILTENLELRKVVNRLVNLAFHVGSDRSGQLSEKQRLKYIQDIQTNNVELQKTIKDFVRPGAPLYRYAGGVDRFWKERSLKYITDEFARKESARASVLRSQKLGCREISQIEIKEELGRGYTKLTQRGVYNGREVAVKSVGLDSTDLHNCVKEQRAKLASDCLLFSRYKIMKELLLYQQLSHPNIVELLGYCFQNDQDTNDIESRGLTVVTQLGTPLNLMTILQMAWHQRFRIAVGLARLIKYFSVSPLGSLVIRDFQLIQFVTMNDEIKLSDLDDTGNEGHPCHSNHDCIIGNQTYNITLPCINNFCRDYNEKWNLYNLERVYFKMFLLPGAPEHVRKDLEDIEGHAELLKYNSKDLVRDLEKVLGKLRNGQELGKYRSRYQYKAIPRADFPGCHDYECDHSTSSVNCQSLAYNEVEAMRQCDDDMECKAFVMSYGKTWIGYRWVYFKNNSTGMVFSANNMIYVKIM